MIVPGLVQGSPAWTRWRADGIGGSDAAIILAADPEQVDELLHAKLNPKFDERYPDHFAPQPLSDAVREFQKRSGYIVRGACFQHDECDWLRCTVGGATFLQDGIVLATPNTIPLHEDALEGEVPTDRLAQIQHCLLSSGADVCWWVSWSRAKHFATDERWCMVEVFPCAEYMAALLEAEEAFWRQLQLAKAGGKWPVSA